MKKAKKASKKGGKVDVSISCDEGEMCCGGCKSNKNGCGGMAYFLGFLGAAFYYISTATSFLGGAWGVIKALVWPAILIFEIMKYIGL